ncbi:MAG: DUF4249 family protein [Bacteroidales bacterium]|nr:DUF4249 family protein [Bacteroidales bacterium]
MMQIRTIIYMIIVLAFSGCIKPYEPNFDDGVVQKYVVQGMIDNQEGWQTVRVSKSTSVSNPSLITVDGCQVEIVDEIGQKFELSLFDRGEYRVWMSSEYLVPGRAYQLIVITPEGEILQSSFDRMPLETDLEDVFYEIETLPTNDPEVWTHGIQFYTNLNAGENNSRYYRWKINETWEYHARFPKEFYYDGQVQQIIPPDSSQMYCWANQDVDEIFTLSTANLDENSFQNFPLHYVNTSSDRLAILYSMLISQIALSEEAYIYWDQLRINNIDGGLYSSQPIAVKGNIENISRPDQDVLGFFQASSIASKRIFIEPIDELELYFSDGCSPALLWRGFIELTPDTWPAYLMTFEGNWSFVYLNYECVNCELMGGITERPLYWPY